jgi:hypothetical protein
MFSFFAQGCYLARGAVSSSMGRLQQISEEEKEF